MSFVKEFKEFAVKGNAMDLAVGVIIGGAFGKIIDSVVNDLIMPIVSSIIGTPDFTNMYIVLKGKASVTAGMSLEDARAIENAVVFAYGNFITVAINFILLALVVFMMVKSINKLKRKEEAAPEPEPTPEPTETEKLLMEIRDQLKNK